MKFNWVTGAEHKKVIAAKDEEIKTLKEQLDKKGEANNGELTEKLTALFGDAAKSEDFDLEAAVSGVMTSATELEAANEKLEAELTTSGKALTEATTKLDAAAKVLGHESAEGVDLAAEIAEIEPDGRTIPVKGAKETPVKGETTEFRCEMDDKLDAELKALGIER